MVGLTEETHPFDALSDDDSIAMSFITWAELLRGAEGSQRREALRRLVPVLYPQGAGICEFIRVEELEGMLR
jgi:tRNA(fMet)-specific endonuclease VapC